MSDSSMESNEETISKTYESNLEIDYGNDYLLNDVVKAILVKFNNYYNKLEETSHIAAFLDPRYKKYCFSEMTDYEIPIPIRNLLEQQQQQGVLIISTKKVSSFLKKLKGANPIITNVDDEVIKALGFGRSVEIKNYVGAAIV
ncbi:4792_t:CDS:2 [Funneliformis caledonium]|uniref:4792_t:CDS:1 n=1 Tax=Funneliformis caledonium TaxID=1117310 RepID=A0A9N9BS74_9GLOM|nr:4792_t:CDS:2 [Funneliformis caledonium]